MVILVWIGPVGMLEKNGFVDVFWLEYEILVESSYKDFEVLVMLFSDYQSSLFFFGLVDLSCLLLYNIYYLYTVHVQSNGKRV